MKSSMAESKPSPNAKRLAGRRILVTGAASGIGLAIARTCRAEGATLTMTDVQSGALTDAADEIGGTAVMTDLLNVEEIPQLVEHAAAAMGGIDGVVNCAGVAIHAPLADLDLSSWMQSIGVNLTGPYALCRAALPWLLRNENSTIVNISSGVGLLPDTPNVAAYAASKGGLIALSRALAAELAPHIRVNVVCPGITRTPMTEHLLSTGGAEVGDVAILNRYAMKRAAEPSEIAAAVLFLTSAESSFVTGATMAVDGGRTFH